MTVAPAKGPVQAGAGSVRPFASAAAVVGVLALAIYVAVQFMPEGGTAGQAPPGGQAAAVAPLAVAAHTVTHAVIYELFGAGGVRNITYVAEGAALAQEREAPTPWSKSLQRTGTEGGSEFYSVSAQTAGSGSLRCRIVLDGKIVSEDSSSGEHAMVTCSR